MSKIMVEPEVPQMTSKRFWAVFQSQNRDVQHCGDAAQTGWSAKWQIWNAILTALNRDRCVSADSTSVHSFTLCRNVRRLCRSAGLQSDASVLWRFIFWVAAGLWTGKVTDISKDGCALIFWLSHFVLLGLFHPEDEGITFLETTIGYLAVDMA